MTRALLDDHLLRDLLADSVPVGLEGVLRDHEPATTNLYLYRLAKSVVSSRGGALTGGWTTEQRRVLGSKLLTLPASVEIVPMRTIAYRMAEIAAVHRVSTLGAESVAASEHLDAPLCVWSGDDGPGIRAAMDDLGRDYRTIQR
ncbi:MAG TPA: hypothetical protein VMN58_09605 [Acidimicrobiales bacterium]|nr:hypothetical protein [Acidimicrobiales bacterium]